MLEQETNLQEAIGQPPDTRESWQIDLDAVICEGCDWRFLFPKGQGNSLCPHCFEQNLVPLTEFSPELPYDRPPEMMVPFKVTAETIANYVRGFAGGIPFAPADLTSDNLQTRLQRIFLPMWLVDSDVQATWQAEAGFNYEAVTHQESFSDSTNRWVSNQITETRINWEPRVGRLTRHYANVPAPALEEHLKLIGRLGKFDLHSLQPYSAEAVAGAAVRLPDRPPTDAWPEAIPELQLSAATECQQACRSDHMRDFRWQPTYSNQHWTLLLLPMYVTYYLDDDQTPLPLLLNGETGQLSGRRQASMKRARRVSFIIAGVAVGIFLISLFIALAGFLLDSNGLGILAGLGVLVAFAVGLASLYPLYRVWQFNRSH